MTAHAIPVWFETVTIVGLVAILLADVFIIARRPHEPSTKESALWVGFYALLAVIFGTVLALTSDGARASEFFAGWLTEYSLSVDNLFVFVIIMARFAVPKKYQQEVLMVGIIMSLILRAVFIFLGVAILNAFTGIFYLFGAFLIYTAIHQLFRSEDDDEESESKLTKFLSKRIAYTETYEGMKLRTVVSGKKTFTPIIVVFITLALTDVMFAFDSIPAIFGITTDGFIVLTANIFALMGLRQLYFLLGSLIEKLRFLEYGISAILAFIGFKLVAHAMHENELPFINGGHHIEWAPEISTETSLIVIIVCLTLSAGASLIFKKKD
ncbi:MAG: TerC/Alx family metal homeostasis membrane protein [Rhodoluna sp.]|nr:TerC/Alx family metal homeostasis membrane protein [Rhodoluna sp.]